MKISTDNRVITAEFCKRDTLIVAPELLGCTLHHRLENGSILSGINS